MARQVLSNRERTGTDSPQRPQRHPGSILQDRSVSLTCTGVTRLMSPTPSGSKSLSHSTRWTLTPSHCNSPSFHLPIPFFHRFWPPNDTNIHTMYLKAGLSMYKVLMSNRLTFTSLNAPSIYQAWHLLHNDIQQLLINKEVDESLWRADGAGRERRINILTICCDKCILHE